MSKWLASEIGVSESEVSRWRHGVHVPSIVTQEAISAALGREISELWPDATPGEDASDEREAA